MSGIFFEEMDIPEPIVNLGVGPGSHAIQTGTMMLGIEKHLQNSPADLLLIYGDTNSTLAAAVVGVRLGIPNAHVEAGLRSFNRTMPEETNRIVADQFADLLFAPTEVAQNQLRFEGFPEDKIFFVGDLMVDAVQGQVARAAKQSKVLDQLGLKPGEYYLATFHRQENTDDPQRLGNIWDAMRQLSKQANVVLPLHPRSRKRLLQHGLSMVTGDRVQIIEPQGYLDTMQLLSNARLLLTDSGGMQKEAFAVGVPCVTMRGETEWVELVNAGANRLAEPLNVDTVLDAVNHMEDVSFDPTQFSFYGSGNTAEHICCIVGNFLQQLQV